MWEEQEERKQGLIRITRADLMLEDHGLLLLNVKWEFEDDRKQPFGLGGIVPDIDLIIGFISVCGEDSLSDCIGSVLRVEYSLKGRKWFIHKLMSLGFNYDGVLDIDEWADNLGDDNA